MQKNNNFRPLFLVTVGIKIMDFWDMTLCSWYRDMDVWKKPATSVFFVSRLNQSWHLAVTCVITFWMTRVLKTSSRVFPVQR